MPNCAGLELPVPHCEAAQIFTEYKVKFMYESSDDLIVENNFRVVMVIIDF